MESYSVGSFCLLLSSRSRRIVIWSRCCSNSFHFCSLCFLLVGFPDPGQGRARWVGFPGKGRSAGDYRSSRKCWTEATAGTMSGTNDFRPSPGPGRPSGATIPSPRVLPLTSQLVQPPSQDPGPPLTQDRSHSTDKWADFNDLTLSNRERRSPRKQAHGPHVSGHTPSS